MSWDFEIPEELALVRRTAEGFAARELRPAMRAAEQARAVPDSVRASWAALGLDEIDDSLGRLLVVEALAAGDAAAAVALSGPPLGDVGIGPRERAWAVVDREPFAFRSTPGRIRGRAEWVPASRVDALVVVAPEAVRVVREGIVLHAGFEPLALHAAGASEVEVDGAIGNDVADPIVRARLLAGLRLHAAGLLLGVASAALRHATEYAVDRVAFGKPVAHHQGVAFLIAELATRLEAARLAAWRGARAIDGGADPTEPAAGAHLHAIDVALEICEQAVQLLGGHGYVRDHPVEKWMREARAISLLFGGRDASLEDAAARVQGAPQEIQP